MNSMTMSMFYFMHRKSIVFNKIRLKSSKLAHQSGGPIFQNLRMKSTLTKRASKDAYRCAAGYKVSHIHFLFYEKFNSYYLYYP